MKKSPALLNAEIVELDAVPAWNKVDRVNAILLVVDRLESANPLVLSGLHLQGLFKKGLYGFGGGGVEPEDFAATQEQTLINCSLREGVEEVGIRRRHLKADPTPITAMQVTRLKPNERGKMKPCSSLVYYMVAELADPENFNPAMLKGTEKPAAMEGFTMRRLNVLRRLPLDKPLGLLASESLALDDIAEKLEERRRNTVRQWGVVELTK